MEGISKERLIEIANQTHDSDDTNHIVLSLFDYLICECKELDQIPEYKELPQVVFAQEGTVINISDGDNSGKWVSTREGWIRIK